MKLLRTIPFTALVLTLTACGGGGGGGDDAPPPEAPVQPAVSLEEFEGVWKRDVAHDRCRPNFVYNTAYASRTRDVTLTNKGNGVLEIVSSALVYGDTTCTVKQGLVTERFTVNVAPATRAGRDNVIKGVLSFVGSTTSADGGLGLTLLATPDGRMAAGASNTKMIGDVHNARLQLATVDTDEPVDADGFPKDFYAENYFVR